MSFDLTLNDQATAALDAIKQRLEGINDVIGESAQRVLMDHLSAKESSAASHATASRLGAQPSGLYADMARSLSRSTGSDDITVSINHAAARQRYHGGTIKPVNKRYLTIPVHPDAYGKSLGAGDFSGALVWLFGRGRKPYAVARESEPTTPLFILAKSVTQSPDPTLLPDDTTWLTSILATVSDALGLEAANG